MDLPTFENLFFFLSGWTDEDQLQIWSSHYSSTNNYLYYLLEVRMRVTSAWSKKNGNINIFQYSVVTQDKSM